MASIGTCGTEMQTGGEELDGGAPELGKKVDAGELQDMSRRPKELSSCAQARGDEQRRRREESHAGDTQRRQGGGGRRRARRGSAPGGWRRGREHQMAHEEDAVLLRSAAGRWRLRSRGSGAAARDRRWGRRFEAAARGRAGSRG